MAEFVLENRKFIVDGSGTPLNESTLAAFETQIGTKLPTQLRSFYFRWNGGLPCPEDIPEDKGICVRVYWKPGVEAARGGGVASFEKMFRINADPSSDFLLTRNDLKHRLPQDVLCFARNPGSSLFLIGIKDYNLGKIYYWSSPYQANLDEGEMPSYDNIADVAESFVEFLLALREEPNKGESLNAWVRRVYSK
jgi:hypothetical protein